MNYNMLMKTIKCLIHVISKIINFQKIYFRLLFVASALLSIDRVLTQPEPHTLETEIGNEQNSHFGYEGTLNSDGTSTNEQSSIASDGSTSVLETPSIVEGSRVASDIVTNVEGGSIAVSTAVEETAPVLEGSSVVENDLSSDEESTVIEEPLTAKNSHQSTLHGAGNESFIHLLIYFQFVITL